MNKNKTKQNKNDTKEKIIHMLHCYHILGIRSLYGAAVARSLKEFSVFDLCKFAKLFIAFYQNGIKTCELLCFTEFKPLHLRGSVLKIIPEDFQIGMM